MPGQGAWLAPPSRLELQSAVFEYIEAFYNRWRRHSTLGMLSPTDYEQLRLRRSGVESNQSSNDDRQRARARARRRLFSLNCRLVTPLVLIIRTGWPSARRSV
jgi:hypothetical protein